METFDLDRDIEVHCIRATSFPEGIMKAHATLHSKVPFTAERNYFGMSRPEDGKISYWTAAEEVEKGDLKRLGLETLVIKKGSYACKVLNDFRKDIPAIGTTFDELTSLPHIDPQGYCIEWYLGMDDVRCMIRLKE